MTSKIRIVAGQWRSRWIHFDDHVGLRPTPNRLRETLFNWLQFRLPGSLVLDLFAGSGVLGFESMSRGAERVYAVEKNPAVVRRIKHEATQLNAKNFEIFQENALLWISSFEPERPFDGVFVDPPFELNLWVDILGLLHRPGFLKEDSWVYVERPRTVHLDFRTLGFNVVKEAGAGDVQIALLSLQKHTGCNDETRLGS